MKDRIRKVMESQHMTQQVFAEFIQIAPATLSSIFTGRTRPTLAIVEAIKNKIPKISTDWLLFGIGDMYEDGSDEDVSVKAQSDSGTKIPSRSVTFLATSLKDANKKWKQYKSQQLNFGHLKVVLFANGKKDEKIIKELVNEPQIAKSVYVLKTDRNLSDIFKKEDKLSISFGEYLSKKLEIKDSKNLTLGRIYR